MSNEEQVAERLRTLEKDNALLQQEVSHINRKVDTLNSGIGRGLWILGGGFIAAFVAWVIDGGLSK